MKKVLSLLFAMVLMVTMFAACGGDETPPANDDGGSQGVVDDGGDGGDDLETQKQVFLGVFEAAKEQQNELVDFMDSVIAQGYTVGDDLVANINGVSDSLNTIPSATATPSDASRPRCPECANTLIFKTFLFTVPMTKG